MTAEKYYSEVKEKRHEDEMYISLGKNNDNYSKAIPEDAYKRIACYILNGHYNGLLIGACEGFKSGVEKAKKFLPSENGNSNNKDEKKTASNDTKKENKTTSNDEKNNGTYRMKFKSTKDEKKEETKEECYELILEDKNVIFDPNDPDIIDGEYKEITSDENNNPSDAINFNVKSRFIPTPDEDEPPRKNAIHFDYNKMGVNLNSDIPKKKKISKTMEKKINDIENYIKDMIPDGLTMNLIPIITGMIELSLSKDNQSIGKFIIDPNNIHGNGNYLIASSEVGIVAVPFKERELLSKSLAGYTLTKEDVDVCRKYIFNNSDIYRYIDLSGDKLKNISDTEYKSLELQLSNVLTSLKAKNLLGRYRILSYKDDMNFVLKSDNFVKCCQNTCVTNLTGFTISINADEVIITDSNKNIIDSFKMVM